MSNDDIVMFGTKQVCRRIPLSVMFFIACCICAMSFY